MLKRTVKTLAVVVFAVSALVLAWQNRYNIYDYINLKNYDPPAEIAKIAKEDSFNDYAKRLFYVNKPVISTKIEFNNQCTSKEQTIVLGCYTGKNIYIFEVDDPRLDGIEQVTAAHEMLHVAYDRLSPSQRKKVDEMVNAVFIKINDSRINSLAENYEKQSPGSVPNELHSIIGTEVMQISPELEEYYRRYFNNRAEIVAFAKNYEQVFEDLRAQVENYDAELAMRKTEINQREANLKNQEAEIKSMNASMNLLLNSGQNRAYNNLVSDYNAKVNNYNQEVNEVKALIEQYNNLVIARNEIIVEQQDLAKSIDSRPDAITN